MKKNIVLLLLTLFLLTFFFACPSPVPDTEPKTEPELPTKPEEPNIIEKMQYTLTTGTSSNSCGVGVFSAGSSKDGSYEEGTSIVVEAVADSSSIFAGWYDDISSNNLISSDVKYTFTINANSKVYARFIDKNNLVNFADSKLEELVRAAASKPSGYLLIDDVKNIKEIYYDAGISNPTITKLDGIQHLSGLTSLRVPNNKIIDITLLAQLKSLHTVDLSNNWINSIASLSSLPALSSVNILNTNVRDLTPLVNNPAFDTGDSLWTNPEVDLSSQIKALINKGVDVQNR